MADSTTLAVSNGHVDSLISYVLDVKPYHVKLSEVVEEYVFKDSVNVKIVSDMRSLEIVGQDFLKNGNNQNLRIWDNASPRPDSTLSAEKTIIPGTRRLYGVPTTVINKNFSYSSKHKFTVSNTDTSEIPGLSLGVLSTLRFDGPGIPLVKKNNVALQEGVDYYLSRGAFSFTTTGTTWRPTNIKDISAFNAIPGDFVYPEISKPYGRIINITGNPANVEEWTLTYDQGADNLKVSGSTSGLIGTATFNTPFVDSRISFTWTYAQDQVTVPTIFDGNQFILTPRGKITIAATAPNETWTLIKTNPIALSAAPVFSGAAGPTPSLTVYTHSLAFTPVTTFTVVFTSPTEYSVLSSTPLVGYPKTLQTNMSFKDDFLHFTIQPNARTFSTGDAFTFTVSSSKPNYLVYGSVSGWQAPATIGQWYFNGKIGFKIPALDYFACVDGDIEQLYSLFAPTKPVHPSASPSVYSIVFRDPVIGYADVETATVENNLYGFKSGLELNTFWFDEYAAFTLDGTFNNGDRITVFLAPRSKLTAEGGYDEFPYESLPYDMDLGEFEYAYDLLQEYFPLYHSYGSVIFPGAVAGDTFVIDKIENEFVRMKFGTNFNALASDPNGWIPLDIRTDTVFPDYAAVISAYLSSDPRVKVFDIRQPAAADGYPDLAALEFEPTFFTNYLQGDTPLTLRFKQQSSWGQNIRVKVSENLNIGGIFDLVFADQAPGADSQFTESLVIEEYVSSSLAVYNVAFSINDLTATVPIPEYAPEYVISFTGPVSITKLKLTPASGPVQIITLDNHPYDMIPTATSTWSYKFSIDPGTVFPATLGVYQTGLGFNLGQDLGGSGL